MIGSAYTPPAKLCEEIRIAMAETDKPFGIDILFAKTTRWRRHDLGLGARGKGPHRRKP
jgi:hypothetical protein